MCGSRSDSLHGQAFVSRKATIVDLQYMSVSINNICASLQDMAGRVRSQHEGHGKVTRRESFKVSHMVHQRLSAAASSQGFGPHITQLMGTQSLDTFDEELDTTQVKSDMRSQ